MDIFFRFDQKKNYRLKFQNKKLSIAAKILKLF
jgi:hypothetical protein